jgi:hypothetical protein
MLERLFFGLAGLVLCACSSAGPYGYSRAYSALDEEEDAVENATEYDPVMAQRDPRDPDRPPHGQPADPSTKNPMQRSSA